jgi:hypothetical protein
MGEIDPHPRQLRLMSGEAALRAYLPGEVALRSTLVFRGGWDVHVRIWQDPNATGAEARHVDFEEPLDVFPSPTLIAQAVLVLG